MNNPFRDHRPTALEEQAHSETKTHFTEQLKQFRTSRDAIQWLERNLAGIAAEASRAAASRPSTGKQEDILKTEDGSQWHLKVELFDCVTLCHRPDGGGEDFAVVERLPEVSGKSYKFGGTT